MKESEDDLELKLPIADGDDDDEVAREGTLDPSDDVLSWEEDAANALDDSVFGDDLAAGVHELQVGEAEGGFLGDEAEESSLLDVGEGDEIAFGVDGTASDDVEGLPLESEDFSLGDETVGYALDGGEEGPEREEDALREDELPALDADHEGDAGDDAFVSSFAIPTRPGRLAWDDRALERVAIPRSAALRIDDDGAPLILAIAADGVPTCLARGAAPEALARTLAAVGVGVRVPPGAKVASRGGSVAFATEEAGVFRALGGGGWQHIEGTASTTALAFVDEQTLLAAVFDRVSDRTQIVRIAQDAEPRIVAEVPDDDQDDARGGRTEVLFVDERDGTVWAAGDYGVVALARRPTVAG